MISLQISIWKIQYAFTHCCISVLLLTHISDIQNQPTLFFFTSKTCVKMIAKQIICVFEHMLLPKYTHNSYTSSDRVRFLKDYQQILCTKIISNTQNVSTSVSVCLFFYMKYQLLMPDVLWKNIPSLEIRTDLSFQIQYYWLKNRFDDKNKISHFNLRYIGNYQLRNVISNRVIVLFRVMKFE